MIVKNVVIPQKVLNPKIVQSKPILMGNITENYICNNNQSHPKIRQCETFQNFNNNFI